MPRSSANLCNYSKHNWNNGYTDPEYLRSGQIGFSSDVYSLGVIIMEILTGVRQYRKDEHAVERWMNRLGVSEGDLQLEQVRVCSEIAIECMDLDPEKRPDAYHIIDRLDKTEGSDKSDETGINSSFIEMQVSLPREQSGKRIGKLADENLQVDVDEHSEVLEDVPDSMELLHSQEDQQKVDELSLCGVQETKQKVNRHGKSIFSSINTVFYKLNSLNIFNKKASRNLHGIEMHPHNIKIFRKEELKSIMMSINLIAESSSVEVYKGVVDNAQVTVKKLCDYNDIMNDAFAKEVIILSQLIHKNIVRLIGCCLEMDTPIVVYEFIPGGSLHDILYGDRKALLSLDVRLTIAAESAHGLAYLHSQACTKILHGNFKLRNILLDGTFVPKISGFGRWRLFGEKHTRQVIGDSIYMDPVYQQTERLTEKSDVYSFGIVILEVISGKKATYFDNNSLVWSFLEVHQKGKKATELFDIEIAVTTGDLEILNGLAEIAVECLSLDVDKRPTMTDVAERLLILNRSRRSQAV